MALTEQLEGILAAMVLLADTAAQGTERQQAAMALVLPLPTVQQQELVVTAQAAPQVEVLTPGLRSMQQAGMVATEVQAMAVQVVAGVGLRLARALRLLVLVQAGMVVTAMPLTAMALLLAGMVVQVMVAVPQEALLPGKGTTALRGQAAKGQRELKAAQTTDTATHMETQEGKDWVRANSYVRFWSFMIWRPDP